MFTGGRLAAGSLATAVSGLVLVLVRVDECAVVVVGHVGRSARVGVARVVVPVLLDIRPFVPAGRAPGTGRTAARYLQLFSTGSVARPYAFHRADRLKTRDNSP